MGVEFTPVFLLLIMAIAIGAGMIVASALLAPSKTTVVKQMPYESGMDPIGDARQRFDVKFYLIAILFLVFDVELLFLYPWAVSAYRGSAEGIPEGFAIAVFWEVIVFLATLVVAYVYAWRKGVFRWR